MSEPQLVLAEDRLSVKQTFNSSIAHLFACFTDPELLARWHAPGTMTVPVAEVDLQVGGRFRISMENAEGQIFTAFGSYREIKTPSKLVYTWGWEHVEGPETLVTVLFTEQGKQTLVELIHEGFVAADVAEHHSEGWTGIFVRLGKFLG